jgi:proteasome lid subunit RPN8/RPN11
LLVLVLAPGAKTADIPVSAPDFNQAGFEALQDAVRAGERAAVQVGGENEAGGAIYRTTDGLYHYTRPVTQNLPTAVDYRVQLPRDAQFVALFHDHPGSSAGAACFSDSDIALARRLNKPMYVLVVVEHTILSYHDESVSVRDRSKYRGREQFSL